MNKPPTTIPLTVLEQMKQDVAFARQESRPDAQAAVMTSIDLLEKCIARLELLEWIKNNVGNIDFHIFAPENALCTNPWIATGKNFEEAVAQAIVQRAALAQGGAT